MKKSDPVKETFIAAGWDYSLDGRSYYHKALRDLVETGMVSFKVCNPGRVFVRPDGKKYNIQVTAAGWVRRVYDGSTRIDAHEVLRVAGQLLQQPQVKEKLLSTVDLDNRCHRCNGIGHIPAFNYFCNGVCFGCMGLGYNHKFKMTVKVD